MRFNASSPLSLAITLVSLTLAVEAVEAHEPQIGVTHAHALLPRQSDTGCIVCPPTPACDCGLGQTCFLQDRDCTRCASTICVDSAESGTNTSCIECPPTPDCDCGLGQTCFLHNRDCTSCAFTVCVDSAGKTVSVNGTATGAASGAATPSAPAGTSASSRMGLGSGIVAVALGCLALGTAF